MIKKESLKEGYFEQQLIEVDENNSSFCYINKTNGVDLISSMFINWLEYSLNSDPAFVDTVEAYYNKNFIIIDGKTPLHSKIFSIFISEMKSTGNEFQYSVYSLINQKHLLRYALDLLSTKNKKE